MARGGSRPGAGRKKKLDVSASGWSGPKLQSPETARPRDFWLAIMRDETAPIDFRMKAAEEVGPYEHAKLAPRADGQGDLRDATGAGDDWGNDLAPNEARH